MVKCMLSKIRGGNRVRTDIVEGLGTPIEELEIGGAFYLDADESLTPGYPHRVIITSRIIYIKISSPSVAVIETETGSIYRIDYF